MSNRLKLQKLTENYDKSAAYGLKVQHELQTIGEEILQAQIAMAKLTEAIQATTKQLNQTECTVRKQEEETSSYEYKMQKLEIRLQEHIRKNDIQQSMLDKKMAHHEALKAKVQELQNHLKDKASMDCEIQNGKQAIEIIDKKLSSQTDNIEKLYSQLLVLNKATRAKEDETNRKIKENNKKRERLAQLERQLNGDDDKENQNQLTNRKQSKEGSKCKMLAHQKKSIEDQLQGKISVLLGIFEEMEGLNKNANEIRKNLTKFDELVSQSKLKKSSLIRLSHMLTCNTQDPPQTSFVNSIK